LNDFDNKHLHSSLSPISIIAHNIVVVSAHHSNQEDGHRDGNLTASATGIWRALWKQQKCHLLHIMPNKCLWLINYLHLCTFL